MSNPQEKAKFIAKLKGFIQSAGYRDGVGMLRYEVKGNAIEGIFADTDGTKAFEFTVNGEGLGYKPITKRRLDSYLYGMTIGLDGGGMYATHSGNAYAQGFRLDRRSTKGKKKNCTSPTSFSCGNACIHQSKQCRIRDAKVRSTALQLVGEAKAIDRSGKASIGLEFKRESYQYVPMSKQASEVLAREEDRIRSQDLETAVVIDPVTGAVVLRKNGERDRVDFAPDELKKFKGMVLTHNHPNVFDADPGTELWKGVSFSPADVGTAAAFGASEVRAVSNGYDHSMIPPKDGWSREFFLEKVAPSYDRNFSRNYRELIDAVIWGRISDQDAEVQLHHRTWEAVARETGMTYKRSEVRRK